MVGMRAADQMIDRVNALIAAHDWRSLDAMLSGEISQMDHIELLTMIRSTYPLRLKLTEWEGAVERARHLLTDMGLNADTLLRGLQPNHLHR